MRLMARSTAEACVSNHAGAHVAEPGEVTTPDAAPRLAARLGALASDVAAAVVFCTRLPWAWMAVPLPRGAGDRNHIARASWALPVAGALVGAGGALVYWVAAKIGLAPAPAAALALAATLSLTGCLHEDGLADTADGFGGGTDRDRKLAIMHDSALGTYGTCALFLSLALRWSALFAIADSRSVALALVAAHVAARAVLPAFMRFVPPARADGLAAAAGRPSPQTAGAALIIGATILILLLGVIPAATGFLAIAGSAFLAARLTQRQIGGQTGDVLGALEQVAEIIILLDAAALLK
jgi:adenosylcobinamide-GDP ribazoletransferase